MTHYREEKYKWIFKYLELKRNMGRDVNAIISAIQAL